MGFSIFAYSFHSLSFRFTRRIKREMLDYYKHIAYDGIHIRRIIFLQTF